MNELIKAIKYYKDLMNDKKEKRKLLNMKTDFIMFERLIQKCNDNPDLCVKVILTSGDIIEMKTVMPEQKQLVNFSGEYIIKD